MKVVELSVTIRVDVARKTPQLTCDILSYMARNCEQASLKSVSAQFGRHPNTVGRAVQDACDMTFGEVLRQMRLQRARALLARGVDLPQAARACGITKPERLRRALEGRDEPADGLWVRGVPRRKLDLQSEARAVLPE